MNRLRSRLMHKNARYRMHSILHNREGEMGREEAREKVSTDYWLIAASLIITRKLFSLLG
jgi:hypothetical protein